MKYAIIGGTGFESGIDGDKRLLSNEYGEALAVESENFVFLSRHGENHGTPPHKINYRANILALKDLGVKFVISTSAVGSMNENFCPSELVLLKDFLDFTKGREETFFEEKVSHVKMDEPYCPNLNKLLESEFIERNMPYTGRAVYAATNGPRFETAAEISFYKKIGADVVGMTNVPEVSLAKELGLCYASVGIITNWATGFGAPTNISEINDSLKRIKEDLLKVFLNIFKREISDEECQCKNSLIIM